MAETNEVVSISDPETEKEVELVESPLVIVNKIIAKSREGQMSCESTRWFKS